MAIRLALTNQLLRGQSRTRSAGRAHSSFLTIVNTRALRVAFRLQVDQIPWARLSPIIAVLLLSEIVLRAMDARENGLAGKQVFDHLPYVCPDNQIASTVAIGRLT